MTILERAQAEMIATEKIAEQCDTKSRIEIEASEDALALIFAEKYKSELRFDHTLGKWLRFNGVVWNVEKTLLAFDFSRALIREFNSRNDKSLPKYCTANAVEMFARADRRLAVTNEIWDCNPWTLCTPDGLVDLRTGNMSPHKATDYHTKCTAVGPSVQQTPVFLRFLDEITRGDQAFRRYLQQVAGYCLTGDIREHALFFIYGDGGNGKSVFVNILKFILGSYAQTAAMETFTASKYDRHPTELARLVGSRFVTASETESGRAWADSRIKQLTGGDPIAARYMRQDFFEYLPQFKLVFLGNHKPALNNVDEAERRRFHILPFNFKPTAPDKDLPHKLIIEYPGILQWMIDGCLDWQQNGLIVPEIVRVETENYFSEQDTFSQWLAECIRSASTYTGEPVARLYSSWSTWAKSNGEEPGSTRNFSERMIRAGFQAIKSVPGHRGKRGFVGIAMILEARELS